MRIPASLINGTIRLLYESLSIEIMERIAKMVDNDFDIYRVSGFRESIPIPPQDCATVVVHEMIRQERFVDLIETLVMVDQKGIMGRQYKIKGLPEIAKGLAALGFLYDRYNNLFMEDPRLRATRNWGRLKEGQEYPIALLRIDIVHNSKIVRQYPKSQVEEAYALFYEMITHKIHKRMGRIWSWEGDGGVAAFYYGHRQTYAAFAAIDILHGNFIFNLFKNPLEVPLQIRVAVHAGQQKYSEDQAVWKKSETAIHVVELESKACSPDEAVISMNVEASLDRSLSDLFSLKNKTHGNRVYSYRVRMEDLE